jgi:hypothetical protein
VQGSRLVKRDPTVQPGAGIGNFLATAFRSNQDDAKALHAAGDGGTMQRSPELKFSPEKRSKISWQINLM